MHSILTVILDFEEHNHKKKKKKKKSSKPQLTPLPATSFTHLHVQCAGCGKSPISGVRYKCCNCMDYDLCEQCESTVQHFNTHVFLKVLRPLPDSPESAISPPSSPSTSAPDVTPEDSTKQDDTPDSPTKDPPKSEEGKSQLPKALIPSQTLIPMVLHRSLYPQKQSSSSNFTNNSKSLSASDDHIKQPASFKDVMSKRNKNAANSSGSGSLSQSLGAVSVDDDVMADDDEMKGAGAKSPLAIIFSFLCYAASPSDISIESLLLGIHIAKKIVKQFPFSEVRDDMLQQLKFRELLESIMVISSPFVQSSFLELLETLLDAETYVDTEVYMKKDKLVQEIRKVQSSLRVHVSSLLSKQQDSQSIEILLELLSILTPKAATATTTTVPTAPPPPPVPTKTESASDSDLSSDEEPVQPSKHSLATKADNSLDGGWRFSSAPVYVASDDLDDESERYSLDTTTTTTLLKFLIAQPLAENSVGYWWNILTLLRGADHMLLIKSPQVMKAIEHALMSTDDIQGVIHDSFKDLLSWLCSQPQASDFRGELLSKFVYHLQYVFKDERQALSMFNVVANILSAQSEKSLPIPVSSEQVMKMLESLSITLKDFHPSVSDQRSVLIGHLLKFLNLLLKDDALLQQVAKGVTAGLWPTSLQLVEWATLPENSSEKSKQKFNFQEQILSIIQLLCATEETCKYFIQQCTTLIKRRTIPPLIKLTLSLLRNPSLVEYFAIELKGYDTLIQHMLAHQTKIVTPSIPELYSVIVNQLATGAPVPPKNVKPLKPGQLEEFHQQCELLQPNGVLANTFKDIAANNGYIWSTKAASKNAEVSFTVKVPYNVVLREVIITVYNNYYVENETSVPPSALTLYAARAQNSVRPLGRFLFKDPSISGSIYTYKFTITNRVVAKFITFKLKHNGTSPIVITRFQVKGNTMNNIVQSEGFNISEDVPHLLAHCVSFPHVQSQLAKLFSEDEYKISSALKLLDFLTGDIGSAVEDILYYLSRSSLPISSAMLKHLLKEEMSLLQAQLVGRLCNVEDNDRINKLNALKTFVFAQLKRTYSVTLGPLMNALCSAIR